LSYHLQIHASSLNTTIINNKERYRQTVKNIMVGMQSVVLYSEMRLLVKLMLRLG
jgi:hypothetical protein